MSNIDGNGSNLTFDRSVHSEQGARVAELVDEILRLHGRIMSANKPSALGSSAQAIVLASIVVAPVPPTVARIARSLGFARQGIQRIADGLVDQGFARYADNPHHKTSKLLVATDKGKETYDLANRESAAWTDRVAEGLVAHELDQALNVLRRVRHNLQQDAET
ncbi:MULTISPECIES: MarR family winged helix-turn-helix transcriptional regulator [unclassified Pseudomonas]|uniref:MarR family winged helix-turn-helix transcriptional regulator n=1 Tax=unclassified Pseudomonas TaxID=196821 RepID=UPI0025FA60AE|nr:MULTISPECIES: MarR family winged helix-turn-helix transcriptional regulator [unclassified Pseudomonas]